MISSFILLIAASFMGSLARRLKHIPGLGVIPNIRIDPMMSHGSMIRTSVNVPHIQMLLRGPDGEWEWPNVSRLFGPTPGWKANIGVNRISQQKIPPYKTSSIEARQLLHSWVDSFLEPFQPHYARVFRHATIAQVAREKGIALPKPAKYFEDDKAIILRTMRDVIAEATRKERSVQSHVLVRSHALYMLQSSSNLEMVGLIPNDMEVSFLKSGSSAVDKSVFALGVFSRGRLKDDSRSSLREMVENLYGKQGARPWTEFPDHSADNRLDVFAIEGLADAPGLPERSARVLLSKIEKYAHQEQKIVVLPKWAYLGLDLAEYYVRLGFEKVQMEDGMHEYVYTGTSSSAEDEWVGNHQIMIGLDFGQALGGEEVMGDADEVPQDTH